MPEHLPRRRRTRRRRSTTSPSRRSTSSRSGNPKGQRRVTPGSQAARTGKGRPKITDVRGRKIPDLGRPGTGGPRIKIGEKDEIFGEGFTKKSKGQRERILREGVRKTGPTTVIRAATARRNVNVNKDPRQSRFWKRQADLVRTRWGTTKNLTPAGKRLLRTKKSSR